VRYSRQTGVLRAVAVGLLAAAMLAGAASAVRAAQGGPAAAQLLVMSDIHFDPMEEPGFVDRLAAAEPAQWRAIFESAGNHEPSRYGKDTNWPLLRSALQQMRVTLSKPAFVLLPGDFLAHQFRNKFDAVAHDHSDAAYRQFVRKTMQFLALQFTHTFPATPILPVLGNNDEDCGDYQLQPNGPFLADTLPILRAFLGDAGREPSLAAEWTSYGNAGITVQGFRVVLANTIFFSRNYQNRCGSSAGADPGRATLAWLDAELTAARRAHQRVWLVYHIPPGIDGYATWRQGSCPDHIIPMWDERYAQPFGDLLSRYGDTIAASFAGHTHMDDFRLVGDGSRYFGFVLITPALSPIFGQNPAFRTVTFDWAGSILDETTFGVTNLGEAGAAMPPRWRVEYTFSREWRLPRLDLASLEQLYAMITTVPEDRALWHTLFPVSSQVYWTQNRGGADEIRAYDCATGRVSVADYRQCWCGGGK
jgi:sphingomyelin phosphodiesterase acid-like 3